MRLVPVLALEQPQVERGLREHAEQLLRVAVAPEFERLAVARLRALQLARFLVEDREPRQHARAAMTPDRIRDAEAPHHRLLEVEHGEIAPARGPQPLP